MKNLFNSAVFTLMAAIISFSGCEAGLSQSSGSSDDSSEFSFSDMYSKFATMQARIDSLEQTVATQELIISTLQGDTTGLVAMQASIDSNTASISAINTTFQGVSRSGNDIVFSGVNVQIVSGSGFTNGVDNNYLTAGTVNGLGNLIVGYNEARSSGSDKSGSHNIIVGPWNNYSSYGGFVVGYQNTISGIYSSVSGGRLNTASARYSSVSGGWTNTASNDDSNVSGGYSNTASGASSSVSGGSSNTASASYSSVSGGDTNIASGENSSVLGGYQNTASALHATVSGGNSNTASATSSSVSGGYSNLASGDCTSVLGGRNGTVGSQFYWGFGTY
ncbi:MAG: hypothetical protein GY754_28655 [bacterium]|nr:hypothetical protein [bacterium]